MGFRFELTPKVAQSADLLSKMKTSTFTTLAVIIATSEAQFNPLEHLGGNSPWFKDPNDFDISPDAPEGCSVDQAAFSSRHGSRYPDPGAYNGWLSLSAKVRFASKPDDPKRLIDVTDPRSQLQHQRQRVSVPPLMEASLDQPRSATLTDLPWRVQRAIRHGRGLQMEVSQLL
jgi:hypothetical protein